MIIEVPVNLSQIPEQKKFDSIKKCWFTYVDSSRFHGVSSPHLDKQCLVVSGEETTLASRVGKCPDHTKFANAIIK